MKMDSTELAAVHAGSVRAEISYAQLRLSKEYQARQPGELKDDPEVLSLKGTIQAIGGLLHNLVVVECADGGYEVCAGGRRWTALGLLVQEGVLPASYPVPCLVIPPMCSPPTRSCARTVGRSRLSPPPTARPNCPSRSCSPWAVCRLP
ncbi:hypothetical protein GG851_02595 [Bordetella petrii]|nr:hypothetical protein [Bordetella petrii]